MKKMAEDKSDMALDLHLLYKKLLLENRWQDGQIHYNISDKFYQDPNDKAFWPSLRDAVPLFNGIFFCFTGTVLPWNVSQHIDTDQDLFHRADVIPYNI